VALDVSSAFNRTGTYTYKDLKGGALELTVTSLSPLTLGVLGGLSKTLNQLQPVMLDAAPSEGEEGGETPGHKQKEAASLAHAGRQSAAGVPFIPARRAS
jgi:hypothetical protein